MLYELQERSRWIDIQANSLRELEVALSYLNPFQLSLANTLLKKQYNIMTNGIGEEIECIECKNENRQCEINVIFVKMNKEKGTN